MRRIDRHNRFRDREGCLGYIILCVDVHDAPQTLAAGLTVLFLSMMTTTVVSLVLGMITKLDHLIRTSIAKFFVDWTIDGLVVVRTIFVPVVFMLELGDCVDHKTQHLLILTQHFLLGLGIYIEVLQDCLGLCQILSFQRRSRRKH